ncbi:M20/M25/M40 family metallo-hydrolase [Stigmatella hybrida]|uniref:M20/M25/M40 family metallo-hydrolase n=1 Tax=Stigmatella hybrida TaxID=394097 RepID=UPI001CDAF70E|nr:M20/M25/M40 family metallo-hydrolase [Stigmatella hybrida]
MKLKGLAPAALLLWGAAPALAHGPAIARPIQQPAEDRELWITLATDSLDEVQATLRASGMAPATLPRTQNNVSMMKVRESALFRISEMMHERYKRCAGFLAHETEAEATEAMKRAGAPELPYLTAVDYTLNNADTANALIGDLHEPNVLATITTLSSYPTRYYKSASGAEAALKLKQIWSDFAASRPDVTVEEFVHTNYNQRSIILTIPGTTQASEVVVLGGHLDSTVGSSGSNPNAPSPGADDDASGIASLTEVIRAALAQDYRPERTVKFIGYAAEEAGLLGSQDIAKRHKSQGINVVGVLQLDMTNYKGTASADVGLITDYTNLAQNTFLRNIIGTYTSELKILDTKCNYGCSDHASWHGQGFPASFPFEATFADSNDYIHTANDTLAQSGNNANHALKFSKIAAAYMAELAKGTVQSTVGDIQAPTVALTGPSTAAPLSGPVTLTATASDNVGVTRVDFLVDGAVKGSDTTAPYSFVWDTATVLNGTHTLSVQAVDARQNAGTGTPVSVVVNNPSTVAELHPALKAPACTAVSAKCDSGTLLVGRGTLGPERNAPNTVNSSCADQSSGSFHVDESNDRLVVSTVDGSPFAPGKTVKIEATVWAYASSPSSDKLDLYYAADANAPVWVSLGTLTPTSGRAQTLTKTYTLPSGGALQAVRARFRYEGKVEVSACGLTKYDDHDDLVFAVTK